MSIILETDKLNKINGQSFQDMSSLKDDLITLRDNIQLNRDLISEAQKALESYQKINENNLKNGIEYYKVELDKIDKKFSPLLPKPEQGRVIDETLSKIGTITADVNNLSTVIGDLENNTTKSMNLLWDEMRSIRSNVAVNNVEIDRIKKNTFWKRVKKFFGFK